MYHKTSTFIENRWICPGLFPGDHAGVRIYADPGARGDSAGGMQRGAHSRKTKLARGDGKMVAGPTLIEDERGRGRQEGDQ